MTIVTPGIINVLKAPGMTSHKVVSRLRRLLGIRQIGHGGTLDPGAAGVLPVFVGRATKLMPYVVELDKTYRAELTLGVSTDTQDASGTPLFVADAFQIRLESLSKAIEPLIGAIDQIPPMTSAVRHRGRRLYDLARAGEHVERKPRRISVDQIDIVDVWTPGQRDDLNAGSRILLEIGCSKGTYVRTLCHDIGRNLGCGAHMSFLVRTRVGPFNLEESYSLEEIEQAIVEGDLKSILLPPRAGLSHLPQITVDEARVKKVRHGMAVDITLDQVDGLALDSPVAVIGPEQDLVCVGCIDKRNENYVVQPARVF